MRSRIILLVKLIFGYGCLSVLMSVSHCPYGLGDRRNRIDWPGAWPCWSYRPYGFFALKQIFRTVRLTVQTVATVRRGRTRWAYLAARKIFTVSRYGFYNQSLRLIKARLDRKGFISSSAFEGSMTLAQKKQRVQTETGRDPATDFGVTVRIDRTGLTVETVSSVWYML